MPTIALLGRVTVTARVNVRQGAPNKQAAVLRKLDAGAVVDVQGLAVGEAVQGNAHWYRLEGDAYIWAGACGPLQGAQTPAATPAASTGNGAEFDGFGLTAEFAGKLSQLFAACRQHGLEFRISQGLRTPRTQALYYCQWAERSPADIDAKIKMLNDAGAPWTAAVLERFRDTPRKPAWQTNALPGAGWHQWGEAADCYCYRGGKMVESGSDPAYKTYADLARELGLTPGYYFKKQDSGHVQLRPAGGATDIYAWSHIDSVMSARFAEKPSVV
ncbi:D-alanyl-D-alanine carboxypeptidase family protein [Phenylobacterium sp.]|uniref:D-alanyl-D-alanine carboxypeptidase family protein n=1 Tax=Phenylobacterium sp. TaxID=1871053 RepID=UPI0025CC6D0E|nr:D-alanyl-D-alanine carboxypeptidase family protein [Phenylobacterium sp.]